MGENQVDWIDKILDSYLHLLLLKMFCRNTKKTRIKPSSYVKLVAMDLNTTENEFGEKLARKIQSTLKTFNVFFTEILRVKNIFVYSKLLIKINQTVEYLRQIHRKKPLPSQTSLFSLFQIEICDFSAPVVTVAAQQLSGTNVLRGLNDEVTADSIIRLDQAGLITEVSTGPMDCTAAIFTNLSQIGNVLEDNCGINNVTVEVISYGPELASGFPTGRNVWSIGGYVRQGNMIVGLPVIFFILLVIFDLWK